MQSKFFNRMSFKNPAMICKMYLIIVVSVIFSGCNTTVNNIEDKNSASSALFYAKRFTIKHEKDFLVLELIGNKENNAVTSTFVLYKNTKPAYGANAYYIKTPVKRVASMSSVYSLMLMKLGEEQSIVAIDNVEYYTNTTIQQKVATGKITELSKGQAIEIEKALALKPDLLFTFGMGDPEMDVDKKVLQAQLPVAISLDHLEETPLARAEWIKFFACFFDKLSMADSLFSLTEKKYNNLKAIVENENQKPSVLTEIKYGDTWYVPSSKSYIANLIKDAGGNFFWKEDSKTGSTPLSFEIVYAKAKDCDIWLNLYNINSQKELLAFDERYALFKPFKNNRLYNNNKIQNAKGYSDYWETGIMNPDEVLADLIYIFYPAALPNHTFTYYKQIK